MDPLQREALSSLRLTWAPTSDDLWRPQGALHVPGLNDSALQMVMAAFTDGERDPQTSPLGVVVQGPAGTGKTHMLGQVREKVQAAKGYFFVVELLDATSFWQSARAGILDSLGRPGVEHETQLKDLLWELSSIAHIPRGERRAVIGDDELTSVMLDGFVSALYGAGAAHKETVWQCRHTLRALVLMAGDMRSRDVGEAFMNGAGDPSEDGRANWGFPTSTATPQEIVRDIARLVALAGPMVLAVDQIDTLIAQSSERTDAAGALTENLDLERVAHGLMSIRQIMRRTVAVVACLPTVWVSISERATTTVKDRFRVTDPLEALPTADVGRAILERRFAGGYQSVGFTPTYPSWPIMPSAFDAAPDYTPRQLLKRADADIRWCLAHDEVKEFDTLKAQTDTDSAENPEPPIPPSNGLDAQYSEYRNRAVTAAVLDHEGEDTTVPDLLRAALLAWVLERDGEHEFRVDEHRGARVAVHARLRQSLDAATEDERHWAFRAIAATHATAVQSRIRNACDATGFRAGAEKRKLFLLRNSPWPTGPKTASTVREFEEAGGITLDMSDDDLRTMIALRDLIDDNDPDLTRWLLDRQPAHGIGLLRKALGDQAGPMPPPVPQPEQPETPAKDEAPAHDQMPIPPTKIIVGTDETTGQSRSIEVLGLRKHTAIFAGSGSGKTVLIRRIVEECALRGVSSIVLDPNNDLSRLGSPWPAPPPGWNPADSPRATEYLDGTEVVVWTPGRVGGRPLSFQPMPDFASVVDDADEYNQAVETTAATLEPKALISGNTPKANHSRAVLKEAIEWYGRQPSTSLPGLIDVLADLPEGVSGLVSGPKLGAEMAENLRASMITDSMFGGSGASADPGALLTPSNGYRARVSVINMIGLTSEQQREGFVNQLQMALFSWIKRNPAGDRPLSGLLVMDEAQNFAPSGRQTACLRSTLALSSQARKYGLGLIYATQAPKGLDNHIPGNATNQFFGLLNSPTQIATATEFAHVKGGRVPEISKLRAGNFYLATEGEAFHRIRAPWCLSYHPQSPPTTEEVLELAKKPLGPHA
jgi:hypothetical protein